MVDNLGNEHGAVLFEGTDFKSVVYKILEGRAIMFIIIIAVSARKEIYIKPLLYQKSGHSRY